MRDFKNLTGDELEKWFESLFKEKLGFADYYPCSGQIQLSSLDSSQSSGEHLEIDGVLLLHKTAVLVEFTSENNGFRNKIRKFTRNCNLFKSSRKSKREKFALFNSIPDEKLRDFEEVQYWRFAYFGTSPKIDAHDYKATDFPDYPQIQRNLHIFGYSNIEYIFQLAKLINNYSKYEFLASLDIKPSDLGESDDVTRKEFLCIEDCYVTEDLDIRAKIFLIKFKPIELLRMGRVARYSGIPFALDTKKQGNYQRLLIHSKLNNIAKNFIQNERRKTFPGTITIVLSSNITIDRNRLLIPKMFSSVEIIDGQHRVFAYSHNSISDDVLNNASILASAIQFETEDPKEISRLSAKIFCEVNSKQTKVKNNLIYVIKYDVLGDKDSSAIAGKILLESNKKRGSALTNIFAMNPLIKENRLGLQPISIVTIIDSDLKQLVGGEGIGNSLDENGYRRVFGHSRDETRRNPGLLITSVKDILLRFFNKVAAVFPNDWTDNSESCLLSAKYISALIRLLRFQLIDESKTLNQTLSYIESMKPSINRVTNPGRNGLSFPRNEDLVPPKVSGINTIYDFLKNPRRPSR